MENNTDNPQHTEASEQPEANSGSNTILIVLLIVILLVIGFLLVNSGPAPADEAPEDVETSAPADDESSGTGTEVNVEVDQ